MLLVAGLVDTEVRTLGETVIQGQFVLSLCRRSNSGCVGMLGDTGSLVGVFVPGCRFIAAKGEVAGDGLKEDELVLDKYVGVKVLPLFVAGSDGVLGKLFLWPLETVLSSKGVEAGDGGVFKIIRFVSLPNVEGGCFCFVVVEPGVTSMVSLGIPMLLVIQGSISAMIFMLSTLHVF